MAKFLKSRLGKNVVRLTFEEVVYEKGASSQNVFIRKELLKQVLVMTRNAPVQTLFLNWKKFSKVLKGSERF